MKKLFACVLLTAAVSLLPPPKAFAGVPACADVCNFADYNTICQTPEGRTSCWDYLWIWGPPPEA